MCFELLKMAAKQKLWSSKSLSVITFSGNMAKMKKIFIHEAGNTLGSYELFVKKLTKRGAKKVKTVDESDVSIVFCPIVSRFETDITSAITSAQGKHADT